ncbi:MAG: type II secretion system F family protein [Candidatus Hydrogenedentes bacterium]|nr:type II secretion system F family protein [Candidatus Hydrogenedentota bacterium]
MNWKQVLKTDFLTILRGFMPPHEYYASRGRVWRGPWYKRKNAWSRDLMTVTTQLESIVRCNAPLAPGLEMAAWDAPTRGVRLILQSMHDDLVAGKTLHESVASRTLFFPAYYADLIKTGETTGTLCQALERVREYLKLKAARWRSIRNWLYYLGTVGTVQFLVMLFLLAYVFPEFGEMLKDFGAQPPAIFLMLESISNTILHWWAPVPALLFVIALLIPPRLLPFQRLRRRRTSVWRRLGSLCPGIRGILRKSDLAHVAQVMERLLAAGVPLNEALQDCAELDLSPGLSEALLRVKNGVEQGSSLAGALQSESWFPESFQTLLALGESSGHLPEALDRISELYHRQTLKATRIALDIGGPCGVLLLAFMVLVIEVAVISTTARMADVLNMTM